MALNFIIEKNEDGRAKKRAIAGRHRLTSLLCGGRKAALGLRQIARSLLRKGIIARNVHESASR